MLRDGRERKGVGTATVHAVDITPEMRAGAQRPQPMFALNVDREIPVTELKGSMWSGSERDLTRLARQVYADTLQGTSVENDDIGRPVAFTSEGKGEAFHPIRDPIDGKVVEALRSLVQHAGIVGSQEPRADRLLDSRLFHTLAAPLRVGDRLYAVKITVRKALRTPEGVTPFKFYDVAILRNEVAPATHGVAADESVARPRATEATGVSLRQLAGIVKPSSDGRFQAALRPKAQSKQQQMEDEAWRKAGMPRENRSSMQWGKPAAHGVVPGESGTASSCHGVTEFAVLQLGDGVKPEVAGSAGRKTQRWQSKPNAWRRPVVIAKRIKPSGEDSPWCCSAPNTMRGRHVFGAQELRM